TIEIDIGETTGDLPELNADVLRVAVELRRIVIALLPFLADRLLGLAADRHRLPSARVIGARSFGNGRRLGFGFRLGLEVGLGRWFRWRRFGRFRRFGFDPSLDLVVLREVAALRFLERTPFGIIAVVAAGLRGRFALLRDDVEPFLWGYM